MNRYLHDHREEHQRVDRHFANLYGLIWKAVVGFIVVQSALLAFLAQRVLFPGG